jgi:Protein of unknown function (DUF3987)/Bifunctional DNA primase/polymerase, N-terminal
LLDNWSDIVATEGEIDTWFSRYPDATNTGVLTRTTPAIDLDVYDPDVAAELETLLFDMIGTRAAVRFGQPPKRAILFRTDKSFKKIVTPTFVSPTQKANRVEVLGDGQQIIVHGIHPETGKAYSWHGGEPGDVTRANLPVLTEAMAHDFIERATAVMDAAGWIRKVDKPQGNGQAAAGTANEFDAIYGERERKFALAALEGRAHELEIMAPNSGRNDALNKAAFRLGTMVARNWIDRAEVENRLMAAAAACGLIADDGERATRATLASGLTNGEQQPHPDLDDRESKSNGKSEADNAGWDDPDISILDDRRGDLPEFPTEVFAPECREWLVQAAHGAGVTAAHVAVPLIGIASALIGTARRVQASRSWTQPCTLWAAVVGFSGSGKTPGLDTVKRALAMIERTEKAKIADMQHAHEAKVEAAKAARALWKKKVEEAASGPVVELGKFRSAKGAAPPLPPEAIVPAPFVVPRLYVSDATIERLAVLLTVRPRGMLHIGDELADLFLNMSRYSSGSDREFWLEAWNGGSFTVERMSREAITVDHLLVGLIGGFQPDKLARSFDGDHDGLYGRVLFAWPSEPPYRALANDVAEVEPEIVNALSRIINLEAGAGQDGEFAPKAVPLAPDALSAFEAFRQLVHCRKQGLDGREREWLAKAQAHALRLAGTLEFLGWAFAGGDEPKQISAQSMEAATRLTLDYFWPHSRASLRQIGLSERHVNARRTLRWLAAERRNEFSREDIRCKALGRTCDAQQTQALIDALAKSGWCKEVTQEGTGAGRPARRWAVNPRLNNV